MTVAMMGPVTITPDAIQLAVIPKGSCGNLIRLIRPDGVESEALSFYRIIAIQSAPVTAVTA
jgi:hypothetical protein